MLEHEKHILPVDLLFDDEQIGDFVKGIQIDSPYQQMLLEGVLTESVKDEKVYVGFTVEGYFHYVLGMVMEKQFANHSAQDVHQIISDNQLNGISEGLKHFLIRDADNQKFDILIWFADFGKNFKNAIVDSLSHAYLKNSNRSPVGGAAELTQNLFKNPTDSDIEIIDCVLDRLEKLQKNSVSEQIIHEVLQYIRTDSPKKAGLFVKAIQHLKSDEKIEYLNRLTSLEFDINEPETVKLYQNIGSEWNTLGQYSKAIIAFNKALEAINPNNIRQIEISAEIYNNLGNAFKYNGQFEESIIHFNKSLDIYISHFDEGHIALGTIYGNLALHYQEQDNFEKAIYYYDKAIKIEERMHGYYHPNIAITYNNLGTLSVEILNFTESKVYYDKSLKIFLNIFGPTHQWVATVYNNVSLMHIKEKNFNPALEYGNKALIIIETLFGTQHPWYATTISNIGGIALELREFEKALINFTKGLEIKLELYGEDNLNIGYSYYNIGKCHYELKKYHPARLYYHKAWTIFKTALGENHSISKKTKDYLIKLNDL
jgi:tetratricopeptide (TPR) repeat protein